MGAFSSTLGAATISGFFVSMLYGITCLQCFHFLHGTPKEYFMKFIVSVLWILDSLHMALIARTVYWYTVINFSLPFTIVHTTWSLEAGILVGNLSDAIVRAVFIYRIMILSDNNRLLWGIPSILLIIVLTSGLAVGIQGLHIAKSDDYTLVIWFFYANFVASVITDFYIAITLCWQLYKSRLGTRRMDSVINTLISYTIGTGLLTSVCSVACVAAYAASPATYIYWIFYFPLSKLYINALLASLNVRELLRIRYEDGTTRTVSNLSSFFAAPPRRTQPANEDDIEEVAVVTNRPFNSDSEEFNPHIKSKRSFPNSSDLRS